MSRWDDKGQVRGRRSQVPEGSAEADPFPIDAEPTPRPGDFLTAARSHGRHGVSFPRGEAWSQTQSPSRGCRTAGTPSSSRGSRRSPATPSCAGRAAQSRQQNRQA